jgi:hypothetical protein
LSRRSATNRPSIEAIMLVLAAFLNALPYVLCGLFVLFAGYGFWQGLSLKPHQPEHRPPPLRRYFWWAND